MPVGVEEEWAAIISEVLHTHCEYDANGEIIPQILLFSKNAMNSALQVGRTYLF